MSASRAPPRRWPNWWSRRWDERSGACLRRPRGSRRPADSPPTSRLARAPVAARGGLLVAVAAIVLGQLPPLLVNLLGGGLAVSTQVRMGWLYTAASNAVSIRIEGLSATAGELEPLGTATFRLALLTVTFVLGWLLLRAGAAAARTVSDSPVRRALAGALVAPSYAVALGDPRAGRGAPAQHRRWFPARCHDLAAVPLGGVRPAVRARRRDGDGGRTPGRAAGSEPAPGRRSPVDGGRSSGLWAWRSWGSSRSRRSDPRGSRATSTSFDPSARGVRPSWWAIRSCWHRTMRSSPWCRPWAPATCWPARFAPRTSCAWTASPRGRTRWTRSRTAWAIGPFRHSALPAAAKLFVLVPLVAVALGARRGAARASSNADAALRGVCAGVVFAGLVVIGVWTSTLTITTTASGDAATLALGAPPFVAGAYAAAWGIVVGGIAGWIWFAAKGSRPSPA